ncbi:MAG: hypothetical protein AAFX41_13930 [Bacteroidota bacterium]
MNVSTRQCPPSSSCLPNKLIDPLTEAFSLPNPLGRIASRVERAQVVQRVDAFGGERANDRWRHAQKLNSAHPAALRQAVDVEHAPVTFRLNLVREVFQIGGGDASESSVVGKEAVDVGRLHLQVERV